MQSRLALLLLFPLVATVGCATRSGPPMLGEMPATQSADAQVADDQSGPAGIDDDNDFDQPSPVTQALLSPFRAIGDGCSYAFSGTAELIKRASGDTSHKAALQLEDHASADNRRNGLNRLMEFPYTHKPPYTKVYEGMAATDEDATVRAAALRACNRSRDAKATPAFIKGLSDKSEWVRLEAAKGLANLPDPSAVPALTKTVSSADENRDVRIAATDALKYYRTLEVARILSSLLTDKDFSICWQARRSLVFLTHRDFGYDAAAWLSYFAGPEKPLG